MLPKIKKKYAYILTLQEALYQESRKNVNRRKGLRKNREEK